MDLMIIFSSLWVFISLIVTNSTKIGKSLWEEFNYGDIAKDSSESEYRFKNKVIKFILYHLVSILTAIFAFLMVPLLSILFKKW